MLREAYHRLIHSINHKLTVVGEGTSHNRVPLTHPSKHKNLIPLYISSYQMTWTYKINYGVNWIKNNNVWVT